MQESLGLLAGVGGALREWPNLQQPRLLDQQQLLHALGVSPLAPAAVLQVLRKMHDTAYPPNWSEEMDAASGALYFYHALRDEAAWQHPLAGTFREVLDVVQRLAAERPSTQELSDRIEACLQETQQRAAEDIRDWVGPLGGEAVDSGDVDPYYFNQRTGESAWEDPRERWQYDLQVRYDLLVGFLVAEEKEAVRANGLQESGLTHTLTTLLSTVGSMASTLETPLATTIEVGPAGEARDAPPPSTPRFGGLRLPPRATAARGEGGVGETALFSLPPHQQRYASGMQSQASAASAAVAGGAIAPHPGGNGTPPPPPPGAAPRWQA